MGPVPPCARTRRHTPGERTTTATIQPHHFAIRHGPLLRATGSGLSRWVDRPSGRAAGALPEGPPSQRQSMCGHIEPLRADRAHPPPSAAGPRGREQHGRKPSPQKRIVAPPANRPPMHDHCGATPEGSCPTRAHPALGMIHRPCCVRRTLCRPRTAPWASSGKGAQPAPGEVLLDRSLAVQGFSKSPNGTGTGSDEPVHAPMSWGSARHEQGCANAPASRPEPRAAILTMRAALRGRDLFVRLLQRLCR